MTGSGQVRAPLHPGHRRRGSAGLRHPETIHYSFFFAVGPDAVSQWLLLGLRTSQSQAPGSTNPVLNLHQFRADGTCCDPRPPNLAGSMAGGKVTWVLPMSKIGAIAGSPIEAHPVRQIQIQIGASGAQRLNQGQPDLMSQETTYVAPGAVVRLGIAPAGTAEDDVSLTSTGTVNAATGAFSGTVLKPSQAGSYIVVLKRATPPGTAASARRPSPSEQTHREGGPPIGGRPLHV